MGIMTRKGQLNEKRAAELYEQAGYETYRPPRARGGPTDVFGEFDILAIRPGEGPLRMVQVKTNRAEGRESFGDRTLPYAVAENMVPEMVVRYDGQGGRNPIQPSWRLLQPVVKSGTGRAVVLVDERQDDVQSNGEGIIEYLDHE